MSYVYNSSYPIFCNNPSTVYFLNLEYDRKGTFTFNQNANIISMGTSPGVEKEPEYSTIVSTYEQLVDLYND